NFGEAKQRQTAHLEQLSELGNLLLGMNHFQPDEKGLEKVAKQVDLVDKSLEKLSKTVDKIQQQEIKQKEYQKEVQDLQEALKDLQQEKIQLEKVQQQTLISLGSIRKELQLLSENLTFEHEGKARQELKNLQKELAQLRLEAEKAEEEYKKIAQGIHVKSGQEKACQEQQKQLEKELEKAQKVYETQLELLKELQEDIPADERKIRQKQLVLQERNLEKAYMQMYAIAENNKKALIQLELLEKNQKEQQQKYLLYNDLSRTANGTLQGSIKVDFETYVQRQYFKQIISAANRRLVRMNHQQFILQCRDMDKLGTQGQVGLDLDVYHLVNDSVRDVKTLSGGESFMAALAMALGLADIIQNEAGAIRLDTMFVDEGFGSLDDESRSQAVQVLLELADDQHLVGIISHVNELKEQMDQKLEVVKNDKGSHIHWVNN
ncbi:MAG: SbcC/MukB-like Walker B domain-containing protein, partial [Lachnospiraceae bacterium]|nr:SbcC/MukB-like Walker B domain-containing protein [Lachnospiraceae bacterium]